MVDFGLSVSRSALMVRSGLPIGMINTYAIKMLGPMPKAWIVPRVAFGAWSAPAMAKEVLSQADLRKR